MLNGYMAADAQPTKDNPAGQVLETLALIATTIISRAHPIRFRLAQTDAEREDIYRLRYITIIERGWAKAEDFPMSAERDEYDDVALHIAGFDGNLLVACARLVFPADSRSLPTERAFDLTIEPRGCVADLSRQIVMRSHSSRQHAIFSALLARCWLEAQARNYNYICGDFTPSMIRLYRHIGLQVTVLGPSRMYWGEERMPIV
ncbi:MAG TPA: hypothetical protein VGK81_10865, partial [Anaerolineae bacterium]